MTAYDPSAIWATDLHTGSVRLSLPDKATPSRRCLESAFYPNGVRGTVPIFERLEGERYYLVGRHIASRAVHCSEGRLQTLEN